jgi:hypothetical protein
LASGAAFAPGAIGQERPAMYGCFYVD